MDETKLTTNVEAVGKSEERNRRLLEEAAEVHINYAAKVTRPV